MFGRINTCQNLVVYPLKQITPLCQQKCFPIKNMNPHIQANNLHCTILTKRIRCGSAAAPFGLIFPKKMFVRVNSGHGPCCVTENHVTASAFTWRQNGNKLHGLHVLVYQQLWKLLFVSQHCDTRADVICSITRCKHATKNYITTDKWPSF